MHVAGREDVYQKPDEGDKERIDAAQAIHREAEVRAKVSDRDPRPQLIEHDTGLGKRRMKTRRPPGASAAATVMTIKTKSCPDTSLKKLEKATNVRLTALSVSSMHINIEITLRLMMTPTTPIVNRTAESARY